MASPTSKPQTRLLKQISHSSFYTPQRLWQKILIVGLALWLITGIPMSLVAAQTCGEHIIASGETLYLIAQNNGTTVDALAAANNIADASRIFAGQQLVIPCGGALVSQTSSLLLPPITTANAPLVESIFTQQWTSRPIDLAVSAGDANPQGQVVILDDAGVVSMFGLDAPDVLARSIGGAADGRFVYGMAVSDLENGIAVAEPGEETGAPMVSSTVTVSGFPTFADAPIQIPIPLEQGSGVTDMALDGDLLITTVGDPTGGPNPDTQPGLQMYPLMHGFAGDLFIPDTAPVTGVVFGHTEFQRLVAAGSVDGQVRVWDISSFASPVEPGTAVLVGSISPTNGSSFKGTSSSMAFSPDGRFLALGDVAGGLWLWDVSNQSLQYLSVLNAPVNVVAFNPDSSVLAMSGGFMPEAEGGAPPDQDNFIHLFDVDTFASGVGGAFLGTLVGHTQAVTGLAFSPDGTQLISIGADNTWRMWGAPQAVLPAGVVVSAAPTPTLEQQEQVAILQPESTCSHSFFFGDVIGDCVDFPPSDIPGSVQYFEGGYMLWQSARGTIIVLHSDGTVQSFPDTWSGQMIITDSLPPADRYTPDRGFGWVWMQNPDVRQRLGWALGGEQGYTMRWQGGRVDSPGPRSPGVEYYQWSTGAILKLTYYDGAVQWTWVY